MLLSTNNTAVSSYENPAMLKDENLKMPYIIILD